MITYKVRFTSTALGQLEKLDTPISQQVLKKLKWLAEHFDESVPIPLTGNLKDIYKLRVGDYRALYTFDKTQEIIVVHAGLLLSFQLLHSFLAS